MTPQTTPPTIEPVRPYGRRGHGRRQLVAAALSLVANRGMHALRLRELAAHAQLSLGSTTYHFPDRETLLINVLDSHTTAVEDTMTGARECARLAPSPTAAVTEMTTALTAHYTDRDCVLIAAEIHLGATRDPAIADLAHRHRAALDSAITETYLYQGQSLERARRQARIAAAVLDRAVLDRATAPADEFAAHMRHVVAALLHVGDPTTDPDCPLPRH